MHAASWTAVEDVVLSLGRGTVPCRHQPLVAAGGSSNRLTQSWAHGASKFEKLSMSCLCSSSNLNVAVHCSLAGRQRSLPEHTALLKRESRLLLVNRPALNVFLSP